MRNHLIRNMEKHMVTQFRNLRRQVRSHRLKRSVHMSLQQRPALMYPKLKKSTMFTLLPRLQERMDQRYQNQKLPNLNPSRAFCLLHPFPNPTMQRKRRRNRHRSDLTNLPFITNADAANMHHRLENRDVQRKLEDPSTNTISRRPLLHGLKALIGKGLKRDTVIRVDWARQHRGQIAHPLLRGKPSTIKTEILSVTEKSIQQLNQHHSLLFCFSQMRIPRLLMSLCAVSAIRGMHFLT